MTLIAVPASLSQFEKVFYKKIAQTSIYEVKDKNVYIFTTGMAIDADGAPKAYNADSKKALDNLGNAGKPGNWWALVTDNGKKSGTPIFQNQNDQNVHPVCHGVVPNRKYFRPFLKLRYR